MPKVKTPSSFYQELGDSKKNLNMNTTSNIAKEQGQDSLVASGSDLNVTHNDNSVTQNRENEQAFDKNKFPKFDEPQAIQQLKLLGYQEGEKVFLRAFFPKGREGSPRSESFKFPNIPTEKIEQWQKEGRGVYFVVNGHGQSKKDVKDCRAFFFEYDDRNKDAQRDIWKDLNLPEPTFQVDTGGKSIHQYYVFAEKVHPGDWELLTQDFLGTVGKEADQNNKDLSRVLRLAGCWHMNSDGKPNGQTRIIFSQTLGEYDFSELRAAIPRQPKQQQELSDIETAKNILESGKIDHLAHDYGDWLKVGMALHSIDDCLLADWDTWSQKSEKYQSGACEKTWQSFKPSGGLTIGTLIHEAKNHGWKQPRRKAAKVVSSIDDSEIYPVYRTVEQAILENTFKENWITFKGAWHQYQEEFGYWRFVETEEVSKLISQELKKCARWDNRTEEFKFNFFKHNNLKSTLGICSADLAKSAKNQKQHLIAFRNGTYNIQTQKLEPHSADNFLTWGVDSDYVAINDCPEAFKTFIQKAFGAEYLELIRALISMYIDPSAPYGYFLHLIGDSGSGKGTLLRFIQSLLNEKNVASIDHFSKLQSPEARHQHLTGVRLCVCPDSNAFQGQMTAFYELVDNGSYSGRALYSSDGYQKQWNVRFAIASTKPLAIENSGDGWERRCIPIPSKPRAGEPDVNLGAKLAGVKAQVISWALGMDKKERDYLIKTAHKHTGIAGLKRQQASFADSVKSFIDSCLVPDAKAEPKTGQQLFDAYKTYCNYSGHKPKALSSFLQLLKESLRPFKQEGKVVKKEGKAKRLPTVWVNISIVDDGIAQGVITPESLAEGGLEAFEEFIKSKDTQVTWLHDQKSGYMTNDSSHVTAVTPPTQEVADLGYMVTRPTTQKSENKKQDEKSIILPTPRGSNSCVNDAVVHKNQEFLSCSRVTHVTQNQNPGTERVTAVTRPNPKSCNQSCNRQKSCNLAEFETLKPGTQVSVHDAKTGDWLPGTIQTVESYPHGGISYLVVETAQGLKKAFSSDQIKFPNTPTVEDCELEEPIIEF